MLNDYKSLRNAPLLLCLLGIGCGPSASEVEAMIEARLGTTAPTPESASAEPASQASERSSAPSPSTAPTSGANAEAAKDAKDAKGTVENSFGLPEAVIAQAEQSNAFLGQLDTLMGSYEPKLPNLVDNTDTMRCITGEERRAKPLLGEVYKGLEKERKKSAKERRKRRREFYNRIMPLNYRIDANWKTRPGFRHEITYDCMDTDDWEWANGSMSKGECYNNGWRWKYRSAKWVEDETLFLYSNTTTPEPPELMKRMEAKGVAAPERFTCIVEDVLRESEGVYACHHYEYGWMMDVTSKSDCYSDDGSWKVKERRYGELVRIACVGSGEPAARIRTKRAEVDLQRGDAISVPLRGVQRPAEGVLLKEKVRHDGSNHWVWVIDADYGSVKVEAKVANCPDSLTLAKMVCKEAGPRSDAMSVVTYCGEAKESKKVQAAAKKLQRDRSPEGKAKFVKACETLISIAPEEPWAYMEASKHHAKAKQFSLSHGVLKRGQGALKSAKGQHGLAKEALRVSKLSAEDANVQASLVAVAKAAFNEACRQGTKPACKAAEAL